jgi:hypothetical protein
LSGAWCSSIRAQNTGANIQKYWVSCPNCTIFLALFA